MRAALYHRVSTTDQDPATARHELRAAATARGYTIAMEVEETGSGARNDRPGLQEVMSAARRSRIDAVLVWKLDRFGRSTLDLLGCIQQLVAAGVRFEAITQGLAIDPRRIDPTANLILGVLAAVSEFEGRSSASGPCSASHAPAEPVAASAGRLSTTSTPTGSGP